MEDHACLNMKQLSENLHDAGPVVEPAAVLSYAEPAAGLVEGAVGG